MRSLGLQRFVITNSRPGSRAMLVLSFLLLCSMSVSVRAEGQGFDECGAHNARPITVAAAASHIRNLEQACVRISGISDGRALYGSLGDIYRDTDVWKDHEPRKSKRGRIGLRVFPEPDDDDGRRPESGTLTWSRTAPHLVTLIGRLHYCGLDWSISEDDEIRMGTGWCHYNGGAVLRPVAIIAEQPTVLIRMTGKRAWRQFGDIAPVKQSSDFTANALDYVHRLFLAAHKGDKRTLLELHGYLSVKLKPDGNLSEDNDEHVASDARDLLDLWLGDSGTMMSRAARSAAPPPVQLYEPRWKAAGVADFWACWAVATLSDKDGPISSLDTSNEVGRPYACIELFMEPDASVSLVGLGKGTWVFKERFGQ